MPGRGGRVERRRHPTDHLSLPRERQPALGPALTASDLTASDLTASDPDGESGFTLVELLVVIVVLGILSGIAVFGVARFRQNATNASCAADLASVTRAATAYEAATGSWPASVGVLVEKSYLAATPSGSYQLDADGRTVIRTPACTGSATATTGGATAGVGGLGWLNGKCADVTGGSTADATTIQLLTCDGGTAQRWTAPAAWPGTITALGKCLDVEGAGTANRTRVQLYTCNGTVAQVWNREADGALKNPHSGRCLTPDSLTPTDGTRLVIYDCMGAPEQRWVLP